jgi:hypothetical protein
MPCDYSKYPKDWKTRIRPDILKRDNNCCKVCKVPNGTTGWRGKDGKFYSDELVFAALEERGYDYFDNELKHCLDKDGMVIKHTKIVLTIMHLDHDTTNNDYSNLAAACQYHHLIYDKEHHMTNARKTRNDKKGLQELF